jgi:hypothetical protein
MKPPTLITIPDELAARYTNPDQAERFDAAMTKVYRLHTRNYSQARSGVQEAVASEPEAARTEA